MLANSCQPELVPITLRDETLPAARHRGDSYVAITSVCHTLGIAPGPQRRKLRDTAWATMTTMPVLDANGRLRATRVIDLPSLPRSTATIAPKRVARTARAKLVADQVETASVLGRHTRPAASVDELEVIFATRTQSLVICKREHATEQEAAVVVATRPAESKSLIGVIRNGRAYPSELVGGPA